MVHASYQAGKWAMGFFGLFITSFIVFVVMAMASAEEWEAESFFDPLIPVGLGAGERY